MQILGGPLRSMHYKERTSIVLPLEAVTMSPGLMHVPLIMFSQAATIKWTCGTVNSLKIHPNVEGLIWPKAFAAPNTAAEPPISHFISSIQQTGNNPTLMLYPPLQTNW